MLEKKYDVVIIGGGIVGCTVGLYVNKYANNVLILEREENILQRASFANQARVHNGYHYPRSFLTALRSRIDSQRFIDEFKECIYDDFKTYYGIGKVFSRINAVQFKNFCKRINAPINPVSSDIKSIFNLDLIEEVYMVEEYVFDAVKLRQRLLNDIRKKKIELKSNVCVLKVTPNRESSLELICQTDQKQFNVSANWVFNCTYSNINKILVESNLQVIPLKHELAEVALITVPGNLKDLGITIMCGPFFSIMPYPTRGLHTLSHVRYTPHLSWLDTAKSAYKCADDFLHQHEMISNFPSMIKDAQRYIPSLIDSRYMDSIWEVKTVLPRSEYDDSRPILFKKNYGLRNLACIIGGKIDNIYDIFNEIDSIYS